MAITRLTERNESGGISVSDLPAALKKLAELEDAEQDGRLVWLPCKVGDIVYRHRATYSAKRFMVREWRIIAIVIDKTGVTFRCYGRSENIHVFFTPEDIGKTVFLTREEAEDALKTLVT